MTYHRDAAPHDERLGEEPHSPFEVSFTYAAVHPAAPAEVQAIVDTLAFTPVPRTTERDDARGS